VERARPSSLDALPEAALAEFFGPAPDGPRIVPSTEEGLVTEEWRDAVCDAVLHDMVR
jgi:hypothetical protein